METRTYTPTNEDYIYEINNLIKIVDNLLSLQCSNSQYPEKDYLEQVNSMIHILAEKVRDYEKNNTE